MKNMNEIWKNTSGNTENMNEIKGDLTKMENMEAKMSLEFMADHDGIIHRGRIPEASQFRVITEPKGLYLGRHYSKDATGEVAHTLNSWHGSLGFDLYSPDNSKPGLIYTLAYSNGIDGDPDYYDVALYTDDDKIIPYAVISFEWKRLIEYLNWYTGEKLTPEWTMPEYEYRHSLKGIIWHSGTMYVDMDRLEGATYPNITLFRELDEKELRHTAGYIQQRAHGISDHDAMSLIMSRYKYLMERSHSLILPEDIEEWKEEYKKNQEEEAAAEVQ